MKDATSQLRSATRRAKSDVANKLVSMFLHELSRKISQDWRFRVEGEEYGDRVRQTFDNCCPYCSRSLTASEAVIEHLDGMNRYRAGLHVPGNVLVACRKCNNEKRRDDQIKVLVLAASGWESFLMHDSTHCTPACLTCEYWSETWFDEAERVGRLRANLLRIRSFRAEFTEFQSVIPTLVQTLPVLLTKLYSDCQLFAETEIRSLLERYSQNSHPVV
jgi:hypothetical protein